jgi:murein DD-endopeptidase MepM/ murein hydrolase activator NlpD
MLSEDPDEVEPVPPETNNVSAMAAEDPENPEYPADPTEPTPPVASATVETDTAEVIAYFDAKYGEVLQTVPFVPMNQEDMLDLIVVVGVYGEGVVPITTLGAEMQATLDDYYGVTREEEVITSYVSPTMPFRDFVEENKDRFFAVNIQLPADDEEIADEAGAEAYALDGESAADDLEVPEFPDNPEVPEIPENPEEPDFGEITIPDEDAYDLWQMLIEVGTFATLANMGTPFGTDENYPVSSRFGYRLDPTPGAEDEAIELHNGIDFATPDGTELFAPFDGMVLNVAYDDERGNYIELLREDGENKVRMQHLFALPELRVGDKVERGDFVALSGGDPSREDSGDTTGAHLHLEVEVNVAALFVWKATNPNFYMAIKPSDVGRDVARMIEDNNV